MNKITCICLGVKNMEKALKFYRDELGFETDCREDNPSVCFFNTPGTKFELFLLDLLAKDIDEDNPPTGNGFSGITLAYNVENKEDVDRTIELVRKAATIVSLIEYPKIVRIAAINGVSISYLSIAITPKAIITS